jgi:integrase
VPYRRANGKRVYSKPIKNGDLDNLNRSLQKGELTAAQAETEIKANLLPELKRRAGVQTKVAIDATISENNMNVFKAFWNHEYRRKKLEHPTTAKNEFFFALSTLEPLSLHTCNVDQLQDHWDKKLSSTRHKRYGNRINQLLGYLKRGFEIVTDRASVPAVKWVSWDELEKILENVSNPELQDLYRSLYATGARLGELFLLEPGDVKANGTIYIHEQLDRDCKAKAYTKNKRAHDTLILKEGLEAVKRWAAVENKESLRKRCQHPLINASKKTFPTNKLKHIGPHKLRHSYVKKMMELGIPLDRIAQFLGDRVSTVESTYRQWTVSDSEIDYVKEIMRLGYSRLKKEK